MPFPESFVLHREPHGDSHILQVSDDRAESIAVFSERSGSIAGPVCALFDPADRESPWRRGDVLIAKSSRRGILSSRSIMRLRVRGRSGYESTTIYNDSQRGAIVSLALDPSGRLYFSEEGSRVIQRLDARRGGELTAAGWASVPALTPWQGDFDFSPDGWLFTSTGAGESPGRLHKFSVSSDPEPASGPLQTIERAEALEWSGGPIEGFSFHDGDRVAFTSNDARLYVAEISASLNPRAASGDVIGPPPLPTFPPPIVIPPRLDAFEIESPLALNPAGVAVNRNALGDYLHTHPQVRESIRWRARYAGPIAFDDWSSEVETQKDLERLLYRFYAYRVADREPPLSYRFEADPRSPDGAMRAGPETAFAGAPIRRRDAAETYLAYLAHFLWMDARQRVGWGLHSLSHELREEFLDAGTMFNPYDQSIPNDPGWIGLGFDYVYNHEKLGPAFPSSPYRAFRFIEGDPAEREPEARDGRSFLEPPTSSRFPRDSANELLLWVADYLTHNTLELGYDFAYYGYDGYPPLEAFYRRSVHEDFSRDDPRHYSWPGCQQASGFLCHLLRLMLIPARRIRTYLGRSLDKSHSGLELPEQERLLLHIDELYAVPETASLWIHPIPLMSVADYQDLLLEYQTPLADQNALTARDRDYKARLAEAACSYHGHVLLTAFWDGLIYDTTTFRQMFESVYAMTLEEAVDMENRWGGWFQQKIDDLLAEYEPLLSAPDERGRLIQARNIYRPAFERYRR